MPSYLVDHLLRLLPVAKGIQLRHTPNGIIIIIWGGLKLLFRVRYQNECGAFGKLNEPPLSLHSPEWR